jgi:Domain of unknown function (DUF4352)
VGDKIAYDKGESVQVYSYEQPAEAPRFGSPSAGTEFAVADVEICAIASADAAYNPLGFAVQAPDNRQYRAPLVPSPRTPALQSGTLPAGGGCVRGWVLLEAPIGVRPAFVVWNYPGYDAVKWAIQ